MSRSPLGPSKRVYLGLALAALVAAGPVQILVERGRFEAFGPPRRKLEMVELWPVLLGGFRGAVVAGLAYYAQEKEFEADIFSTRSSVLTLTELQPEFDQLWIYYAWVISYNLTAIKSPPDEKYVLIRDGVDVLERGVRKIADLYEGRKPFVNNRDPITARPIDRANLPPERRRTFDGQTVAFADDTSPHEWDRLPDDGKALRLEFVRDAPTEYKRKRATLLWTLGWMHLHKLSEGEEAKAHYRRWYIRDTGKDPFQVAYQYQALASALDVPPYQVSYGVIKTGPVFALEGWARALAEDPMVDTAVVAEAFERASREWAKTLPFLADTRVLGQVLGRSPESTEPLTIEDYDRLDQLINPPRGPTGARLTADNFEARLRNLPADTQQKAREAVEQIKSNVQNAAGAFQVALAMRDLADAEAKAAVHNAPFADAYRNRAHERLEYLRRRQQDTAHFPSYDQRFEISLERQRMHLGVAAPPPGAP